MRYAFFIDKLKNGGAERVTTILANYFAKENEVYLFVVDDSQIDYEIAGDVHIVKVPFEENKIKRMLARKRYVAEQIREIGFDACITLTYTFLPYLLTAPKKKRGKVIASLRNAPQFEIANPIGRIFRWIGFSLCDKIVFQTPDARDYFSRNIQKRGVVIPNPLSEGLPYADNDNSKTIITATRLETQKNIPLALDAFKDFHKTHPEWTFRIYGRGSLKDEIEELIMNDPEIADCVQLMGFSSDIHNEMAHSAIFILSSDFEGLSNSMIEAMAIGLPVVCTDCPIGGAKMMIENGKNGFLIPTGNKKAIVSALCYVADNVGTSKAIGAEAAKVREKLSAERICQQWNGVIAS